ncbi:MAG: DNA polymerase I [Tidjanibacter sp.]|nr:DNA polymerase I [Tidjanibacter sp.]
MKKLFLIDAYALIFRSYYAFMQRPMRNAEGLNTSAIFGFTKFLREIIVNERPDYLGVAFDPHGGNFRNDLFPEYKANRSATPEDIIASVPHIKSILEALRIPILEVPRYEADDVIGTLAHKAADEGFEVFMVTPDKDFGQLVRPTVHIYKQRKGGEGVDILGPEEVCANYGINKPEQVIDILALWGDASDNIPGVQGVGEKGASKLVREYGSVESILENVDKIKGKLHDNLVAGAEQLRLSKVLATIATDAPIEFNAESLRMEKPDCEKLTEIYRYLDFRAFLREMASGVESPFTGVMRSECGGVPTAAIAATPVAPPQEVVQTDLFGAPIATPTPKSAPATPTATPAPMGDLFSAAAGYATADSTLHTYTTITTRAELIPLVEELRSGKIFCFDTESTGFDPHTDRLVGLSLSASAHSAAYVSLMGGESGELLTILRSLFEDEAVAKVGQNMKFDIMMLRGVGIEVRGAKWDTMLLHYLIDPESRHNMDFLAMRYLDYQPIPIENLIGRGAKQTTMDKVPLAQVAEYAAEDADITWQLYEKLRPMAEERGVLELYHKVEEPLIEVLADMEWEGVKVDTARLAEYGTELSATLAEIEEKIRSMADTPDLNINSAKQLGVVLFEKLQIDGKPKKTKTKQYRTDEEYLTSLSDKHPIVSLVLEYRGLKKLLSTYIEALPQLVNRYTGRIHTSYNQAVTATGRLSSTNPNLQNIPVREEQGRLIRKAFVPADSDHILLAADYSQVELRLMAHLSGDEAMIEAFRSGEDIHRDTAARLFHTTPELVTSDQRRKAKTANFGIIYGISAFGLRQRISGISLGEARDIIEGYFASYPKVKSYIDRVIGDAREMGFVETLFGRRRYLPDINSGNANTRAFAERNAVNAPIQGSAADIMKLAMIAVHSRLQAEGLQSKMILQVHDELVVDTLRTEQERVERILHEEMEKAAQLTVPLLVECGVGEDWLAAH